MEIFLGFVTLPEFFTYLCVAGTTGNYRCWYEREEETYVSLKFICFQNHQILSNTKFYLFLMTFYETSFHVVYRDLKMQMMIKWRSINIKLLN